MSAIVITAGIRKKRSMVFHDVDAGTAQASQIFAPHFLCSLSIEHRVYSGASVRRIRERFSKLFCNFAIDEVVGLKINGTSGRANRAQHRWKNLIAVDQRGDFITADKIRTEQRTG